MGWDSGFDVVKKHNNLTPYQYFITNDFKDYLFNDWAREHYDTFEDYYKSSSLFDRELTYTPSGGDAEFYKKNPEENLINWCSIGRWLDDYILPELTNEYQEFEKYLVTKEFIEKMETWVDEELEKRKLIPVYLKESYKYVNEYGENSDKILSRCDGLYVEDEDGNIYEIDREYDTIWISKGYDEDKYYALTSFKETLNKMKKIDLDKNWIFYYRSY